MRETDDGSFRDGRVRHERALDLGRAEAVARDVDHVVDSARDPVVAVFVAARAVAREVLAGILLEIGVDEALMIAVNGAHLAGPAVEQHEVAGRFAFEDLALLVDDRRPDAEEGLRRGARLQHRRAG